MTNPVQFIDALVAEVPIDGDPRVAKARLRDAALGYKLAQEAFDVGKLRELIETELQERGQVYVPGFLESVFQGARAAIKIRDTPLTREQLDTLYLEYKGRFHVATGRL
ncbi:hypothetical protein HYX08_02945 [Candidatus Woesearchaeota archaeon]|nr:hypothetical protein [Candidatus Woesearchaeota archaeon]